MISDIFSYKWFSFDQSLDFWYQFTGKKNMPKEYAKTDNCYSYVYYFWQLTVLQQLN